MLKMPARKIDERLAKQFPTYIKFVLKQQWVRRWQHLAILLFPVVFYVLLICLKALLIWMTESPIPLSFVDKLLSMLKIPFAPTKAQKQYLPYRVQDPNWDIGPISGAFPNSGSYSELEGPQYLAAASYEIGHEAAISGPIDLLNFRELHAILYHRDVPVLSPKGKLVIDNSMPSILGLIYDQWQQTFTKDKPQILFKSIGWIDIPDVDYITRNLVNDSAYLLFIFINHILLPLTVVDMVTERVTGFTNLLQVSGMKATVFYVANFIFYYMLAVVLGVVNYAAAAAFGLEIKGYPARVLVITLFFPFYELPLAFLLSFCFSSVFTASVVMWFGIVLIPEMLLLIANAFDIRKNFLAWFLPSASISYINSKDPLMISKMKAVSGAIVAQSLILFGIAITVISILNYGEKVITSQKEKKEEQEMTVAVTWAEQEVTEEEYPIEVHRITKKFGTRKNNLFYALDSVSFNVCKNEIKGLIGHNGSGKTTLMSIITKTARQTSGTFSVKGFVCYCPQLDCLPGDFIVGDVITLFAELRSREGNSDEMAANKLVELMSVQNCLKKKIKTCSYGDRRKVQLISAAVNSLPEDIILLDEVTTNLSRNDVLGVWEIIKHFKNTKSAVLFISHDLDEVGILCDKVVMLKKGKVALHADPKQVIRDTEYEAVEILEPLDADRSIESIGYTPRGNAGGYRHFIVRGRIESLPGDLFGIIATNQSIIKSANLETVFEQVEALE